jgi:hypothetical protein
MPINKIWIMFLIILMFMPFSNGFGQGSESGTFTDGYGSYGAMGQDPDEILEYGRKMMRYGFLEGSGSGFKYPGYNRDLDNETVKKLNTEQETFINVTEDLRQTIYEKELYLKVELAKKEPDNATALSFQKELSDARGEFDQLMIQHLIRMKKINLEAENK